MKDGLKNIIIVGGCIVVLILFAIFSINRRNEFEIENKRVDNIISNIVVDTSSSEDNNVTTSEYPYFILYNGQELDIKMGRQVLDNMELNEENKAKYNIKYTSYSNGKKQTKEGKLEETYEGYGVVQNVDKIAISADYNAIPRKVKSVKTLPEELKLKLDYTNANAEEIDLDGDDKKEYLIVYEIEDKKENIAKSTLMLFDSNYQKVATLMELDDGISEDDKNVFISLKDITYVDIDNDGVLEILVQEPTYEGDVVCVYKYTNGSLEGEINVEATLKP